MEMSTSFAESFDGVVVHDGPEANEAASSASAAAFTIGTHIAFARQQYDPSTALGRHILAHELAHVVQQRRGRRLDTSGTLEHYANAAAERYSRGQTGVQIVGVGTPTLARLSQEDVAAKRARTDAGVPLSKEREPRQFSLETNDDTIYIGMNPASAPSEYLALPKDTVNISTRALSKQALDDLYKDLSEDQAQRVKGALAGAQDGSRDVLGRIAREWSKGLKVGRVPARIVISGHSDGAHVGSFVLADLLSLAKALPEAALFIEDIHLSGCNTAVFGEGSEEREKLLHAFPNLKTFWGYQGSSNLVPLSDLQTWETQTRGAGKPKLNNQLLGRNVTTAVVTDGKLSIEGKYIVESKADLEEEYRRVNGGTPGGTRYKPNEGYFSHFYNGYRDDKDYKSDVYAGIGAIYEFYQVALVRTDAFPADWQPLFVRAAAQALRLRFYHSIRATFQSGDRVAILEDGYKILGQDRSELKFDKLTRNDALAEIVRLKGLADAAIFHVSADDLSKLEKFCRLLHRFRVLDPRLIPLEWCHE